MGAETRERVAEALQRVIDTYVERYTLTPEQAAERLRSEFDEWFKLQATPVTAWGVVGCVFCQKVFHFLPAFENHITVRDELACCPS